MYLVSFCSHDRIFRFPLSDLHIETGFIGSHKHMATGQKVRQNAVFGKRWTRPPSQSRFNHVCVVFYLDRVMPDGSINTVCVCLCPSRDVSRIIRIPLNGARGTTRTSGSDSLEIHQDAFVIISVRFVLRKCSRRQEREAKSSPASMNFIMFSLLGQYRAICSSRSTACKGRT